MATTKLVIPACPFSLSEVKGNRRDFKCMSNAKGGGGGGYRPALILPGLGNNSSDYQQLSSSLEAKGVRTVVANVSRPDWLRNAAGLLDGNYWKGTLRPRPVLDWYLKKIEDAISTANQLADGGKISLIGHSAGGWLARVYLAEYGFDGISLLLTLGTPHLPPPKGVSGVIDQTRGLLDYVEKYCPVSSYASQLKVVCIAGRYVKGERFFKNQSIKLSSSSMETVAGVDGNLIVKPNEGTIEAIDNDMDKSSSNQLNSSRFRALIVGQGYKQVCGKANVWGDGVVPEVSAHLEGAKNITLEGVYHSPVGADDISRPWYGSNTVLDKWMHHLQD
ncbi:hypothetical protein SUGI_0183210 [Cryptomeria japonica]|uniref:uncharacterized protein LOC131051195 isoform X1 n=1 Tax=Cryptomeria japonica TaxID=3369 RepID=UPI002408D778|nr:uncharacterized protein LOC131051195 isoform X1 [Cryptomeria japonica]GLJ12065.1 hypothetical protein SUGI_0183210 [Cryptomeria japonica]